MPSLSICRTLARGLLVAAVWAAVWAVIVPPRCAAAASEPALAREPTWSIPTATAVRSTVEQWPAGSASPALDPARTVALQAAWDEVAAGRRDLLDTVVEAIGDHEPRAAALVATAARGQDPAVAWLDDPATDAFVRDAMSLWWGRELVRRDRFDEALPLLARLDVGDSVDPATALFHRAACEHWLLQMDEAIESLDRLLERESEIPVRYARVARLLRADITAVEKDSLDHIARRMRDVTRRLDLGSAGPTTREVQDGVIASLDKLIERLEDQQRQEQQGESSSGAGSDSGQGGGGRPMDDSRIARGRGTGEVRKRDLAPGESWGNLPPHDRERALQQIGREFPPHYREAIEQYFKRLATGAEDR
jgi:tetratricopeptide (TPR) repeat protein